MSFFIFFRFKLFFKLDKGKNNKESKTDCKSFFTLQQCVNSNLFRYVIYMERQYRASELSKEAVL